MTGTKLKDLKNKLHNINTQIGNYESQMADGKKELAKLRVEAESLRHQIKKLTAPQIVVSEHAMLRYIERVFNVDMKQLENDILDEVVVKCATKFGNGKFPHPCGLRAVVKDGVIVTMLGGKSDER